MTIATISLVIPVLNEQDRIANLLRQLSNLYPVAELLVVDGGSSDNTVAEALPWCNALLTSTPGRAAQMNLGASVAAGEYVFFLHADTVPVLDAPGLASYLALKPRWGFSRVRLSGDHWAFRIIEAAMNLRSRLTHVATGDQMLFVQRQLLLQMGGFAAIELMEDIELCKRLRREAAPLLVREPVQTSSRRWEQGGIVRTVLRMWFLRFAYVLGVSPQRLGGYYHGR